MWYSRKTKSSIIQISYRINFFKYQYYCSKIFYLIYNRRKDVHHVQYSHLNIFYFTGESLCHERWYSWSCRSRHECCGCVVQCSSSSADCWLLRLRSSNISSIWVSYLVYFLAGWNSICSTIYQNNFIYSKIQEKL